MLEFGGWVKEKLPDDFGSSYEIYAMVMNDLSFR